VRVLLPLPDRDFDVTEVAAADDTPAFVAADRNYLSARWPGDAYLSFLAERAWPHLPGQVSAIAR
jgi:hypothetical protein